MEHSTSASNERVWRITQLAKLSFNHPSVVLTADVFQFFNKIPYERFGVTLCSNSIIVWARQDWLLTEIAAGYHGTWYPPTRESAKKRDSHYEVWAFGQCSFFSQATLTLNISSIPYAITPPTWRSNVSLNKSPGLLLFDHDLPRQNSFLTRHYIVIVCIYFSRLHSPHLLSYNLPPVLLAYVCCGMALYHWLLSAWCNVAACVVVLWPQSLYLFRTKNQRGHWVCWMSTSRKKRTVLCEEHTNSC